MYVCIELCIEFDKPYNIIPIEDVHQKYSLPQDRLRPYLDDGFEVVCIDPLLYGVPNKAENEDDSATTCPAGEKGFETDSDETDWSWTKIQTYVELPDAYYDAGRYVYMVKELEDISTFDRKKYEPDDYHCTLMYEYNDWVYIQASRFRPINDPFTVSGIIPFKQFPYWPDTVKERTPEEKAAEKDRIQSLYNSVRRGELQLDDLDIIDLLVINGMMREEVDKKKKDIDFFELLMQQFEDGVPFEELRRQLLEYEAGSKQ